MRSTDSNISAIVKQFSEPLYWHIRRLVVSHEDAEDILQDCFVKAFRKLWQLRDEKSLKPWLYRIASNEVNSFYKRRMRTEELSSELLERLEESEYINLEDAAGVSLQKAILGLSPQQRLVFCLKYYEDMDYEQISYVTGSRPETLKVVWHNARKKVENFLKES